MARINVAKNFAGKQYATKFAVASMQNSSGEQDFSKLKIIGDCNVVYGADGTITLRIGPALNCSLFNGTDGISTATVSYQAPSTQTANLSDYYSTNDFIGTLTDRKIVVNQDGGVVKANCGTGITSINATTGAVTKGNEVHFQGDGTCKFKVYVNAYGKDFPFVVGPISGNVTYNASGIVVTDHIYILTKDEKFVENKKYYKKDEKGNYVLADDTKNGQIITAETYYELVQVQLGQTYQITSDNEFVSDKEYYIFENGSFSKATVTAGNAVTAKTYFEKKQQSYVSCKVTNYRQQPKTDSGASGYCANVNFTFTPQNLFVSDVDFKLVKIEQIQVSEDEKQSVVATWSNTSDDVYVYLVDFKSLPGKPSGASYVLSEQTTTNTKKISGITYLTTSTTMTPSAQGLFNCGYPGYVTNKLNCAYSGGKWFNSFDATDPSEFETWTTKKDATMDWEGSAQKILRGIWDNPQITVKGTNMYGSGTGVTSAVTNNKICVCDNSGYVSDTSGTYTDATRYAEGFASAFSSTDLTATNNADLQTFDGCIVYPTKDFSVYNKNGETAINPDYSTCSGTRYAYLKLTKSGTIMGGTVTIKCVASPEDALTDDEPSLKIQLSNKPNDETSWMDLMDIGTSFKYDTITNIGFSIPQASSYGNGMMYCRVIMTKPDSGQGVKIKSITLS